MEKKTQINHLINGGSNILIGFNTDFKGTDIQEKYFFFNRIVAENGECLKIEIDGYYTELKLNTSGAGIHSYYGEISTNLWTKWIRNSNVRKVEVIITKDCKVTLKAGTPVKRVFVQNDLVKIL